MQDVRHGQSGRREHVEQQCRVRDAYQRHADEQAEQHDRRHDVVGERIERIGRNVEIHEVERLAFEEQRRAEERRVLIGRKHQREDQDRDERDRPEQREDQPDSLQERPRLRGVERAESADDRHCHIRQDRHLQQLDVRVGDDLQPRRPLARENPERQASDADGDLRQARSAVGRRAAAWSLATVSGYRGTIPADERGHVVALRRPSPDRPATGIVRRGTVRARHRRSASSTMS